MPQTQVRPSAFTIDQIDEEDDVINVTLNSNLAITIANILVNNPNDNPAVYALAKQLQNAVKVMDGRATVNDFKGFEDTEVIRKP